MTKFEYEYTHLDTSSAGALDEDLKGWGGDGWELLSVNLETGEAIFKRAIHDERISLLKRIERVERIQLTLLSALADHFCPNSELLGEAIEEMRELAAGVEEEDTL